MKRILIGLSLLILAPVGIYQGQSVKAGLYLEKGVGIPELIEIGDTSRIHKNELEFLQDGFGLNFKVDIETKRILHISCNKPGCITDNNVEIGDPEKIVISRYGPPLQEKRFKEKSKKFYAYNGVAFMITGGLVTDIYIIPWEIAKK